MNFSFHPSAVKELASSVDYYESLHPGLGLEFTEEIYSTIQRILEFPNAWAIVSQNCRRCMTRRFPYGIIYHIKEDEILIISVMQLNQNPKTGMSE